MEGISKIEFPFTKRILEECEETKPFDIAETDEKEDAGMVFGEHSPACRRKVSKVSTKRELHYRINETVKGILDDMLYYQKKRNPRETGVSLFYRMIVKYLKSELPELYRQLLASECGEFLKKYK